MGKIAFALPPARSGDSSEALRALRGCTVLGINPPVCDFAWFDLWSKPTGLLSLLQALRDVGNDVRLVDCLYEARTRPLDFGRWKVERTPLEKPGPYAAVPRNYYRFGLSPAALARRLASLPRPDLVLVTSSMTYWYPGVFETIRTVREVFPDAPVLLGGAYARLCPEHAALSGADFVQTAPFTLSAPSLPLDLYDGPGYGVLTTSWGCPMGCDYCASRTLWGDFRQRPLDEILRDLHAQASIATVSDMAFYDDALLLFRERVFYPLCRHVLEHFPRLRLHTPNGLHVAQLDEECCRVLFQTGFATLRLSLEGVDPFTEGASARKTGPDDYRRAVESLSRAGYAPHQIETYILAGLPGQDPRDVIASIETVKRLGGRPKLAEFSPIPGTALYAAALRRNPELAAEPLLHNNTVYAPYVARTLSAQTLQDLKDRTRG